VPPADPEKNSTIHRQQSLQTFKGINSASLHALA
jgi:hypothetical protein